MTDALGGITKYTFDKDNRLIKTIDAEGNYQIFFYNPDNNQIGKTVDGSGNATEITYRGFSDCGTCAKTFQDKPVLIEYLTSSRYFKYNDRGLVIE